MTRFPCGEWSSVVVLTAAASGVTKMIVASAAALQKNKRSIPEGKLNTN